MLTAGPGLGLKIDPQLTFSDILLSSVGRMRTCIQFFPVLGL